MHSANMKINFVILKNNTKIIHYLEFIYCHV